ncbi:MAG: hypothetical protein F6K39_16605, partial [Okeania sp. SIO3B3]|nr:hypothetical protein [Okeania sp. SIO3B3]
LSHKIVTGQLRQKLGFNGLVVTDALCRSFFLIINCFAIKG